MHAKDMLDLLNLADMVLEYAAVHAAPMPHHQGSEAYKLVAALRGGIASAKFDVKVLLDERGNDDQTV